MLKALKNKRGSAIVWALLVLAMLSVLIATALTISFNYAQRSRSGVDAQQCYFTARSVAEAVAQDIVDAKTPSLLPESASDEYPVSAQYDAVLPDQMGVCTVSVVHKSKNAASVTATAKRGLSSYSYTIDLAADSVVVPFFEGGLYVYALGENSPIQSVNRDLYIAGSGASVIDFPVSGNVFAPYSNVKITGSGGVAGTIIANSINYEGDAGTDRFMPIAAISNGAGSQSQSLENNITEQRMLLSEDYASLLAFDEDPDNDDARKLIIKNKTVVPDYSAYSELPNRYTPVFDSTATNYVTGEGVDYNVHFSNLFGKVKDINIVISESCSIMSFYRVMRRPNTLPSNFVIAEQRALSIASERNSNTDYNNTFFAGVDSSTLTVNGDTSLTLSQTTYLGTLNGAGSVVVTAGDAVDKRVEILSLGWKITGSEEGAA